MIPPKIPPIVPNGIGGVIGGKPVVLSESGVIRRLHIRMGVRLEYPL